MTHRKMRAIQELIRKKADRELALRMADPIKASSRDIVKDIAARTYRRAKVDWLDARLLSSIMNVIESALAPRYGKLAGYIRGF